MISQRKIDANRRNSKKGGRPTRKQDAETDRLAAEIIARADARTAKLAAKKLIKMLGAGGAPAPATLTAAGSQAATDDGSRPLELEQLVAELLIYSGTQKLLDVQWRQVYLFCKTRELEGNPIRTQLFLRWQAEQEIPAEFTGGIET